MTKRIAETSPQFMGVPLPLVLGALAVGLAVRPALRSPSRGVRKATGECRRTPTKTENPARCLVVFSGPMIRTIRGTRS